MAAFLTIERGEDRDCEVPILPMRSSYSHLHLQLMQELQELVHPSETGREEEEAFPP